MELGRDKRRVGMLKKGQYMDQRLNINGKVEVGLEDKVMSILKAIRVKKRIDD